MRDQLSLFRRLEEIGRVRLSTNFFLRDFLHSEIAVAFGIVNQPDHLELAVEAGSRLCNELLEPLHAARYASGRAIVLGNSTPSGIGFGWVVPATHTTMLGTSGMRVTPKVEWVPQPPSSFLGSSTTSKTVEIGARWHGSSTTTCVIPICAFTPVSERLTSNGVSNQNVRSLVGAGLAAC
jgi:hypothetical protein